MPHADPASGRTSRTHAATTKRSAASRLQEPVARPKPQETLRSSSMQVRHKVGTIAGTMALSLVFFSGTASAHTESFNQRTATYVKSFIGRVPYAYGGSSPSSGFDCSGLTKYVYGHFGGRSADSRRAVPAFPSREQKVRRGAGISFSSMRTRTRTATSTTSPFTKAAITWSRRLVPQPGSSGRQSGRPM